MEAAASPMVIPAVALPTVRAAAALREAIREAEWAKATVKTPAGMVRREDSLGREFVPNETPPLFRRSRTVRPQ